jgi:hypothetical protein
MARTVIAVNEYSTATGKLLKARTNKRVDAYRKLLIRQGIAFREFKSQLGAEASENFMRYRESQLKLWYCRISQELEAPAYVFEF